MTTSTVKASLEMGTGHRDLMGFCDSFDPSIPLTTEVPVNRQDDFLLSFGAGSTCPPRNWALLWRIEELEQTPEPQRWAAADWPNPDAFRDARAFIEALPDQPIPLPNLGLADDGEVNFLWKLGGAYIDLGFYGTGTFSYFARGSDNEEYYDDDIPARRGLPERLLTLLTG